MRTEKPITDKFIIRMIEEATESPIDEFSIYGIKITVGLGREDVDMIPTDMTQSGDLQCKIGVGVNWLHNHLTEEEMASYAVWRLCENK
jgi:hypothetical protein